jgi:hypothetical protein
MAFKSLIEAAMLLGFRPETIEYLVKSCPKKGEDRKLAAIKSELGLMFDEAKLLEYDSYLADPWPMPEKGHRPYIPKAIQDDVKDESHFGCAICGHMDSGEIAHIDPVATTLNNSPRNLIYLCPNHHTKYDYGFKATSNITIDEIRAAKLVKRSSRNRVFKYEANATRLLQALIRSLKEFEKSLSGDASENMKSIYLSEMHTLLASIPALTKKSNEESKADKLTTEPEKELAKLAPKLAALASALTTSESEKDVRSKAAGVVAEVDEILIEIDEVNCPHCEGRGQYGLAGDFCAYCNGSCVVSQDKFEAYDPDEIDEVNCPRCDGRGTIGLNSDMCAYCKGSCVVSHEQADEYDPNEIDEVNCPRCEGRGQSGLVGDQCAYCKGSCVVSQAAHDSYNPDEIDEVNCPRCEGRGQYGMGGDFCAYCKGSCVVSQDKFDAYDPDEIDEVTCPRCYGRGTTGLVGDTCALCNGSSVVSDAVAHAYREQYED